jgi:hypothetical protein
MVSYRDSSGEKLSENGHKEFKMNQDSDCDFKDRDCRFMAQYRTIATKQMTLRVFHHNPKWHVFLVFYETNVTTISQTFLPHGLP